MQSGSDEHNMVGGLGKGYVCRMSKLCIQVLTLSIPDAYESSVRCVLCVGMPSNCGLYGSGHFG